MNTKRNPAQASTALAVAIILSAGQAFASPGIKPSIPETVITVSGDCYAIGQQIAAQNGGTLARADQASEGGQEVCRIVVLLPAKEGKHPRRAEFVVPRG